jgi:ribosomal protein L13E
MRVGGFKLRQLKAVPGLTAHDFRYAGYAVDQLRLVGFTADELLKAGCNNADLRIGGFPAKDLRDLGKISSELKQAGYAATHLEDAGFTAKDLKDGGFQPEELTLVSFSTDDFRAAGFSVSDMRVMGIRPKELKDGGFSLAEIKAAGFPAWQLREAFPVWQLTQATKGPLSPRPGTARVDSHRSARASAKSGGSPPGPPEPSSALPAPAFAPAPGAQDEASPPDEPLLPKGFQLSSPRQPATLAGNPLLESTDASVQSSSDSGAVGTPASTPSAVPEEPQQSSWWPWSS